METIIKTDQKTLAIELAEKIAKFNVEKITDLLSEKGQYFIQDKNDEIAISDKINFISWLNDCIDEFQFANEDRNQLNFVIDQCLGCSIGNPVLIFEIWRFPVFTRHPWEREKCGLMLEFEDNLISGITFCFVF